MTIVFVCAEYPKNKNSPTGGFGRYVQSISDAIAGLGHSVVIICLGKEAKAKEKKHKMIISIDPHRYTIIKVIQNIPWVGKRCSAFVVYPLLWSLLVHVRLQKLKRSIHIDLVEGGDFAGEMFFYSIFNRDQIPLVIRLHTPSFIIQKFNEERMSFFYMIMTYIEKFSIRRATAVYSPTKSLASLIVKETGRKSLAIIPYPFPEPEKIKKNQGKKFDVLYVGKLQKKKGVFTLLSAVNVISQRLPTVRLALVGPDTYQHGISVKSRILMFRNEHNLRSNIFVIDPVSRKRLASFYNQSRILIIPSVWENFPNVALEAMIYGVPVIAASVGGLPEMITDGKNGLLFQSENIKDLVKKIAYLLRNQDLQVRLTNQARKDLYSFDPKTIATNTLLFYRSILQEKTINTSSGYE